MKDFSDEESKALFLRFSSLGDVILTLPAVRCFKAAFPRARVTYLSKSVFAPLFAGNPDIDRFVGLEGLPGEGSLSGLVRFCRRERYDLVVDLHRNLRGRLASLFTPAPVKLAVRKGSLERRLWAMGWMRGRMGSPKKHVVERYLDTLDPLVIGRGDSIPRITVTGEDRGRAEALLRAQGVREPAKTAVILPGARWPNKCWSVTGFAALGRWLRSELDLEVVLAGDEWDREQVEKVKRNLSFEAADLCGRTGLRDLAGLLSLARVVVGNDSGPGHLAAAVGAPVVAIFGPTSEAFGFAPRGERVRVVSRELDCRPCSVHGGRRCPRGRRSCLDDIAPGAVMEAVKEVIRR